MSPRGRPKGSKNKAPAESTAAAPVAGGGRATKNRAVAYLARCDEEKLKDLLISLPQDVVDALEKVVGTIGDERRKQAIAARQEEIERLQQEISNLQKG